MATLALTAYAVLLGMLLLQIAEPWVLLAWVTTPLAIVLVRLRGLARASHPFPLTVVVTLTALVGFVSASGSPDADRLVLLVTAMLLSQNNQTMVPKIASFLGTVQQQGNVMFAVAAVVSATVPLFLLVMFFQRQIVSGLTAGAVKG